VTLPYDQIPPEHRTMGDLTDRLDEHNGVLGVVLGQLMARDDSKAEPGIRRAANTAMDAIDAMVRELHALRRGWCRRPAPAMTSPRREPTRCCSAAVRSVPGEPAARTACAWHGHHHHGAARPRPGHPG
jgi:hypothetical protein